MSEAPITLQFGQQVSLPGHFDALVVLEAARSLAKEIGANAALAEPDLDHGTLKSRGGLPRAPALFGWQGLPTLLGDLNTALAA
jgi:hypothetical protein